MHRSYWELGSHICFACLLYRDNGKDYTAYTDSIIDELVSEGTVALIEAIRSDRYAPDAGKFSTYVYPFIKGAMHRWLESNIGAVAVSKHEMQKVRQAQQMYHEGIPINEITQSLKLSEAQLSQLLNYNTHALSLDQLIEEDFSSEGGEQPHYSMEYGVMLKIWLSLLPESIRHGIPPSNTYRNCTVKAICTSGAEPTK